MNGHCQSLPVPSHSHHPNRCAEEVCRHQIHLPPSEDCNLWNNRFSAKVQGTFHQHIHYSRIYWTYSTNSVYTCNPNKIKYWRSCYLFLMADMSWLINMIYELLISLLAWVSAYALPCIIQPGDLSWTSFPTDARFHSPVWCSHRLTIHWIKAAIIPMPFLQDTWWRCLHYMDGTKIHTSVLTVNIEIQYMTFENQMSISFHSILKIHTEWLSG
jgi:hypothetical protein